MTWTAPDVERRTPIDSGSELDSLNSWLAFYRDTLLWKCAGLTAEQLREQSCAPSNLSLLGLVRHMTDVETAWFRNRIGGAHAPFQYWTTDNPDGDFEGLDDADPQVDFAVYAAECEHSESSLVGRSLDEAIDYVDKRGNPYSRDIRWIVIHMVEEYARHLGHADLLRERIDGSTGY